MSRYSVNEPGIALDIEFKLDPGATIASGSHIDTPLWEAVDGESGLQDDLDI